MTRFKPSVRSRNSRASAACVMGAMLLLSMLAGGLRAADPMVVEKMDGPVTAREIQAFKDFMRDVPVPSSNVGNAMISKGGGDAVEALGRVFEICGDVELLDRMLDFTDRMLAGRNDPKTGQIIWTGNRELVWPNQEPEAGKPAYSATENGDVVGHIAYAARLILDRPKLWDARVPDGDPLQFGDTYRRRAETYARELDRTIDTFIMKWLVDPQTLRYRSPDSPLFAANSRRGREGEGARPIPWNQQMMLNNGFQRLAECHHLLKDDPERARRYDAIVKASIDWFFQSVERTTVKGRPCCNWGYTPEKPVRRSEDIGHGGKDIEGLYRAYLAGRYGITREMMEPLANTAADVIVTGPGRFAGQVSGAPGKAPPKELGAYWIALCEFRPQLLAVFTDPGGGVARSTGPRTVSHLLWQKHRLLGTKPDAPAKGN